VPNFTWDIDPVLFKIGPLAIRYYSLLFVGVFLGGYALLKWQIVRGGGDEEDAGDFIVYGVLGVLIGSRLGHVLFYDLDKALNDPAWVLQIWEGGLASHGAVIGLILVMWLFTRRRGISFIEGSDRFAFSAALGAALVRLGNFFNSEIVGRPTDQTWGVRFPRFDRMPDPPLRHPSQLYEVALGLIVLGALYAFDKRLGKEERPRGALISAFFLVYFIGRFIVEFWKEHQTPEPTPLLTMGQYLSIPGILLGVYGLWWSFNRRLPAGWIPEDYDEDEDGDLDQDEPEDEEDLDANLEPKKRKQKQKQKQEQKPVDPDVLAEFGKDRQRAAKKSKKKSKKAAVPVVDETPPDENDGEPGADKQDPERD
jgi:phosphatidylglycerol---prolipoprotein diacylglyceryl transferase